VSSIVRTLTGQSPVNVVSFCARVARAVEEGGLNTSPEGLARAPPSQ
jgi:hypothetical protein